MGYSDSYREKYEWVHWWIQLVMIETKIVNEILPLNDPRIKGGYTTSFQLIDVYYCSSTSMHKYVNYCQKSTPIIKIGET